MPLLILLLFQVTSKKDQRQYWCAYDHPYQYVPVMKFAEAFALYRVGKRLSEELAVPYNRHHNHPAALSYSSYGVNRFELLKANFAWQLLLMKRNSFVYIFKFIQVLVAKIFRTQSYIILLLNYSKSEENPKNPCIVNHIM